MAFNPRDGSIKEATEESNISFLENHDVLETRLYAAMVFCCSLAEFQEIKALVKKHLDKLIYQRIAVEVLWIVPKSEVVGK